MTTPAPAYEAVIRSPLGEIRVWIEAGEDGAPVKTSVRLDFADDADALRSHDELARVSAALDNAVRRLTPAGQINGAPSPVIRWIADRCESSPGVRTPATDLFRDFVLWCDAHGVRPMSQKAFGVALGDRGYRTAGKSAAGLYYRGGIRLKAAPVALAAVPARSA